MAKRKIAFVCQECGYDSAKWYGKCPGCGGWNTMTEEVLLPEPSKGLVTGISSAQKPIPIAEVALDALPRYSSGSAELDRVLGGGIIPGSFVLVVGDPGIGKSSITLQVCAHVAAPGAKVLYVTGEESTRQVRMRAERLRALNDHLYILSETNLELIEQHVLELRPKLLVIDSIQTVFKPELPSAPGSVSQVRECAAHLLRLAKTNGIATFIVGHVTKDGSLAGPRVLEHIVDTVLFFEGDRNFQFRVLRAVKNRFGSTNEIGLFEMQSKGLIDVPDASRILLAERSENVSGSVIVPTIEGTRPLLIEIQALVSSSSYFPPRRTAEGIDIKRVQLILAVLEKRVGLNLTSSEVFVKVAGGIAVTEPAVDLGLAVVLASSFRDVQASPKTAVFGEVGLSGEVRSVTQVEARLREAEKMGFKRVILPKASWNGLDFKTSLELIGVNDVSEALKCALED